ncbi:outer membrane beta-barrel protein [Pedobacter cryotolerans]|uniref:TonB-dependent receptor n=1 Tax=Pedobacter cryotolerans TaxID=2571270 RepID=A0A4U1BXQ1_9SPHI|nr:outer membrane beta-barrel protein [Pedobacter cryotolerans]TKB97144.1 TonB-dependent receptor [Pedobacter cryotolerans]
MKSLLTLIISLLISIIVKSQTTDGYSISGNILDSVTNKPINFATVILKNEKNVQLKSVLTNKEGFFNLDKLANGTFQLLIINVGSQNKKASVVINNSSKNFGNLFLVTSPTQLKGVTISAERPLIKQEIDRITYDLKADPESKVNSVLEMMRKVPMLSVDGDDNIQLQGNSNYKILINGRPSGMMERNPKDILKSMPASSIERIEVITTPPAKYDGEGLSGIINIITFKKLDNGTNGTINVNHRFPVGGPGMGGSFTLKSGKFGMASNFGGNLNSTPLLNNSNTRFTTGINPTNLFQTGVRDSEGKSGYIGTELSFEIDSLNLISAQINYNASDNESFNAQNSLLSNNNAIIQRYELNNNLTGSGNGIDAAINYQLGFKKDKNQLLTFSYRYYDFTNNQFNNVNIINPIAYNLTDYQQFNSGGSKEQTLQVDYTLPIKKLIIEAGAKAIFRDNNSNFEVQSLNQDGNYIIDALRTNIFDNTQNVYGIYNTYQFNLKQWGIKAGLRAEQTAINANFYGANEQFTSNALNFIPSISINRKFKNNTSINFGASSRIQRPGINQLNPFVDRSNPNFETTGNPDLKPMSGNSVEMSFSSFKKLQLNVGLRGMFFKDIIMPRIVTDEITNITRSSYGNNGTATMVGLNVNANYPFSSKLRASLNLTANYGRVSGEVNGTLIETKGLMKRAFGSLTYKPSKTWQATGSVNYNGRNFTLQGSTNAFVTSSLSINKDFLANKLSISLAANNAFNKYRNVINSINGPSFTQESFNQNYQRNFTTSINYRFGKLKEAIKKNKKGINNSDVSSGAAI